VLWKAVGKATEWKASGYRYMQISRLFSMEKCDQAVMDFLAATDVEKFPPKRVEVRLGGHSFLSISFVFIGF
jgi:hypothetical protein